MKKVFLLFFCSWCFVGFGISKFKGDLSTLRETCKWRSKILEVCICIVYQYEHTIKFLSQAMNYIYKIESFNFQSTLLCFLAG